MKRILTYRGVVYPWHCDQMGHMNVMYYVGKFDEATWNMLAAIGITRDYMGDRQCGAAAVVQNIIYKRELVAGDVIDVWTQIASVGDRKVRFVHEMFDAQRNELCATCDLLGVHMNRVTRRATPFPPEIRDRALEFLTVAES